MKDVTVEDFIAWRAELRQKKIEALEASQRQNIRKLNNIIREKAQFFHKQGVEMNNTFFHVFEMTEESITEAQRYYRAFGGHSPMFAGLTADNFDHSFKRKSADSENLGFAVMSIDWFDFSSMTSNAGFASCFRSNWGDISHQALDLARTKQSAIVKIYRKDKFRGWDNNTKFDSINAAKESLGGFFLLSGRVSLFVDFEKKRLKFDRGYGTIRSSSFIAALPLFRAGLETTESFFMLPKDAHYYGDATKAGMPVVGHHELEMFDYSL